MDSAPAFSVILPVYNRELTLNRCLESIRAQSYPPFEVIVVDDGSEDASADASAQWADRIPNLNIIRQANAGVAAARNTAIAAASGNWLAFIDSDDEWQPEKLAKFAALIQLDSEVDMLHSDRVAANGSTRLARKPTVGVQDYETVDYLFSDWALLTSTIAVRSQTAADAGAFIENLYSCSDYEWFWRVACLCRKIRYVPEPLTVMHDGPLGMARKLPSQSKIRDNIRAMASSIRWMEARPDVAADRSMPLRKWRKREFKNLIRANIAQRRFLSAASELGKYLTENMSGQFLYLPVSRKAR